MKTKNIIVNTTLKLYNESHLEIDPFGEEDWGEHIYKKGDVMIALKDKIRLDGRSEIKGGRKYIILTVSPSDVGNFYVFFPK
jgi:hypothetical protein